MLDPEGGAVRELSDAAEIQRQELGVDGSVQAVRPMLTKGSPASTDCLKLSQVPVTAGRSSIPNAFLPGTRDPARYSTRSVVAGTFGSPSREESPGERFQAF